MTVVSNGVAPGRELARPDAAPAADLLAFHPPRRGRVGRLTATLATVRETGADADPGREVVDAGLAPVAVLRARDDAAAVLTRLYAAVVRGRGDVHVVQLTPASACDLGAELAVAARIVGDRPRHRAITPAAPGPGVTDRPGAPVADPTVTVSSLRRPRIDGPALRLLREARAAVVVADTARSRRRSVVDALEMLDGLGVDVRGLVVWRGRIPRDPAWAPADR